MSVDPSPFVNVREMHAMEEKLLGALAATEARLLAAMAASDAKHDLIHSEMRSNADSRHRRIDDFIKADLEADTLAAGRTQGRWQIVTALRFVNEFRWLIVAAVLALIAVTNNVSLSIIAP